MRISDNSMHYLSSIPRSETMGFDLKGASKNRASLFAGSGIEWPENFVPEDIEPRLNDYPFSVDLSNNYLLVSLDRKGAIRRAALGQGSIDVRGGEVPGVYTRKQFAYFEGMISLDIQIDDRALRTPSLQYIGGIIPEYCYMNTLVAATLVMFVPKDRGNRNLYTLVKVANKTRQIQKVTLTVSKNESIEDRYQKTLPIDATILSDSKDCQTGQKIYEKREKVLCIEAGETLSCAIVYKFGSKDTEVDIENVATIENVEQLLQQTYALSQESLGSLVVPESPWFGEELTRAQELARQSVLKDSSGKVIGSFWGSNANPKPDVWMRDFAYTTLGLVEVCPELAYECVKYLCVNSVPSHVWGTDARGHDITSFEHSLGNACMAAVLLSLLVRRWGSVIINTADENIRNYLQDLTDMMLKNRPEGHALYATDYISDGYSRGDYHIGSNILAWRAAQALSEDFSGIITQESVPQLTSLCQELRGAIMNIGLKSLGSVGQAFVEGVYRNGEIVAVHDAEESDLALASVYGLVKRDDLRISRHMRWAHSIENPYYAKTTGGIDFWDWDGSNGVSYPGHISLLKLFQDRKEERSILDLIQKTSDLDGSFWWWPFAHKEPDSFRVKRGLGKCGWCAGEYVSIVVHDLLGISCDADRHAITISPYLPWSEFSLTGFAFLGGRLNIELNPGQLSVANDTDSDIDLTLQLALQPGQMLENVQFNGEARREQAAVVQLYDSTAVCLRESISSGQAACLEVAAA